MSMSKEFKDLKDTICARIEKLDKDKSDTENSLESKLNKIITDATQKFSSIIIRHYTENKTALRELRTQVSEVKTLATDKRNFAEKADIITFDQLVLKHNLQLPLKKRSDFEEFDQTLSSNNNNLQQDLVSNKCGKYGMCS